MAQYPLHMGKDPQQSGSKPKTLAVQLDAEGKIRYDAIARQGHGKDKVKIMSIKDGIFSCAILGHFSAKLTIYARCVTPCV